MVKTGYIGIVFMGTMPIVVFFGDYQVINNALVNVSFLLTFMAYTKYHLYQSKLEFELLNKINLSAKSELDSVKECTNFNAYYLTRREVEIAHLMLQKLTYSEIANDLFIGENTVSKHGSNIIKKTKCKNKAHFISNFSQT